MKLLPSVLMTWTSDKPCPCGGTTQWQFLSDAEHWILVCLECGGELEGDDTVGLL